MWLSLRLAANDDDETASCSEWETPDLQPMQCRLNPFADSLLHCERSSVKTPSQQDHNFIPRTARDLLDVPDCRQCAAAGRWQVEKREKTLQKSLRNGLPDLFSLAVSKRSKAGHVFDE